MFIYWIWNDCQPDYSTSIMALFFKEGYADIVFCYGYYDDVAAAACCAYLPRPDCREPGVIVFIKF